MVSTCKQGGFPFLIWFISILLAVAFLASPAFGADLAAKADQLLGIPYRPDGVRDESGRWTLFEHPEQSFATPGLNCSGLDYALMRLVAPVTTTIRQAARDRQGDSGPGASMGQDWDFGFDLILNLSEGLPRRWLMQDLKRERVRPGKLSKAFLQGSSPPNTSSSGLLKNAR